MYKVTKFPQGTFSWADAVSTNPETATKFYEELMGWDKDEVPMGDAGVYVMFKVDGSHVGGLGPMQKEMQNMNVPSHWNNYVTVDDVDAMVDKVTELGGKVVAPPFDVFDSGRMMTVQDPTGAMLNLWQAKNHIGSGIVNTVGAMSWNELVTSDAETAQEFYKGLLGWEFEKDPNQDNYTTIMNNGRPNGGIIQVEKEMAPAGWVVYYTVADIDETLKKTKELGGTIHIDKREAPGVGHLAYISDPTGAVMAIIQLENPQPWEAA